MHNGQLDGKKFTHTEEKKCAEYKAVDVTFSDIRKLYLCQIYHIKATTDIKHSFKKMSVVYLVLALYLQCVKECENAIF